MRGLAASAYQSRGFETVEPRHVHVQENHRELVLEQQFERLFTGGRGEYLLLQLLQNRLERDELVRAIVNHQYFGGSGVRGLITPVHRSHVPILCRRLCGCLPHLCSHERRTESKISVSTGLDK